MAGLDEATLVAFVDGELDPVAARDVARLLADDPEAQEKVRLLRRSASLVRAAFAGSEWQDVPPRVARLVARSRGLPTLLSRRRLGIAIAASVAGIAGVAGGIGILAPGPGSAAHLMDEVAEYHTAFAHESRGLDVLPASAAPKIESWFAGVLGRKLGIPDLSSFDMTFQGARLLFVRGRPVTQFLYAVPGNAHHPFGVCVTAWPNVDHAVTIARREGVDLAFWARHGFAYVLVGWTGAPEMGLIVAAVRPVLEAT
jgi:anti-sigma factor RsiW